MRDLFPHQPIAQEFGLGADGFVHQMHAGSGHQVWPQFPHRGVEANRGQLRGAILGGHGEGAVVPLAQIQQAVMANGHGFWRSGRARSVNHIRQLLGSDTSREWF